MSAMNESLLTGKRDLSESISQSMRDRDNLLRIQEKKTELATQGENEAPRKLSEIEADVEIRKWEQRNSEIALFESDRELNLKFIKRTYGPTVLTERGLICVENWK